MTLSEYLAITDQSQRDFARSAGIPESTVSRLVRGTCRPDWMTIDKVKTATRGKVTANDFDAPDAPASTEAA